MRTILAASLVAMTIFCSQANAGGYGTIGPTAGVACVGLGFYEYRDMLHDGLDNHLAVDDARLDHCILIPVGTEVEVLSDEPIRVDSDSTYDLLQIRVPGDYVKGSRSLRYIRVILAAGVSR